MEKEPRVVYPFKFLDAYTRQDKDIFFGRKEEIAELYEMSFQTKMMLVYGPSGTGKTSLVQCGLANQFQTFDWLAITIRRNNNLNDSFTKMLEETILREKNGSPSETDKKVQDLSSLLETIYLTYFKPIYLIFDQFEELYILGNKVEQLQFYATVQKVLNIEQPIKMIFILREEYFGFLSDFEKAVPLLLRKKIRIEPMYFDKVEQVIMGVSLLKMTNVSLKQGEESRIIEKIFDTIKGKEKTLSISLPYLQVFLDNLYLHITRDESRITQAEINLDALEQLGSIENVLRNFLEEQVIKISKQLQLQEAAVWKTLTPFVTLEGTKEPKSKDDFTKQKGEFSEATLESLLFAFLNSRILRYVDEQDRYEIAHDSLAEQIAKKRSDEEIALLEIYRLIRSHNILNDQARDLFSEKQLNLITSYLPKLNLTEQENALIEESRIKIVQTKEWEKEQKQKELDKERQLRQRASFFSRISGVIAFIALGFLAFAIVKTNEARESLNGFKREQSAKDRLVFNSLHNRVSIILDNGGCPQTLLKEMENIAKNNEDSTKMRSEILLLSEQLMKRKCP